ncbi:MAG: flagellar hook-basal body complex protein [Gammaproteobacteria bacterium]|nr:flagellar hook-basal body complex protein [Gammaproteobacteria bacterium]
MDKSIYISMSGARAAMRAQTVVNHNLANASTVGFRAELPEAATTVGADHDARAYAGIATTRFSDAQGAIMSTGRPLDVAIRGAGWLAVEASDGSEAYTRAGDLRVDAAGVLRNAAGHAVRSENGAITVPSQETPAATIARIKLVRPDAASLERRADGLFRLKDGSVAPADRSVTLESGMLESSNVNLAAQLVQMIEISRRFEWQMRGVRTAEENARNTGSLLRSG